MPTYEMYENILYFWDQSSYSFLITFFLSKKLQVQKNLQWATKVVETVDWVLYYQVLIPIFHLFHFKFGLHWEEYPSPFSLLYRKESRFRNRKSNIVFLGRGLYQGENLSLLPIVVHKSTDNITENPHTVVTGGDVSSVLN